MPDFSHRYTTEGLHYRVSALENRVMRLQQQAHMPLIVEQPTPTIPQRLRESQEANARLRTEINRLERDMQRMVEQNANLQVELFALRDVETKKVAPSDLLCHARVSFSGHDHSCTVAYRHWATHRCGHCGYTWES